jgi:translocation and assembly module TamB
MVLSGELRRQHVRGELTARGLPVILAKRFLPAPISGNLDADLDIRGVPARPRVDLRLRGKRLRPALPRYSDAEPLDADLTAALADGRLTAGFRATGLGPEATTARVGMDLDFSLVPLKATLPAGAALSATAQGSVALELLQGYLLWTGHAVDGLVTYRARADGPARRPAISASLDLEDANYENAGTGLVLRDMQGRVRTRDTSLILEEFSARDPEGGGISAHGVLAMNWAQGLPFEINLAAEDLALLRRDDIQAEASASLRLDGNMDESGLTGTMTLTPVHVRIPDTMPAEVAEVDVRQINTPEVQAPPRPRRESRHVMTLDADLILPGPFTVQGHGLDSQWTGALHLEGTAAKPVIKGRLDLARGTFNFLNKRFTLTEGELYFPGTHPPQPHINLRAEAKSGDVTAIVVLRGEAASPDLSLLSDPALPKDEILARILFGKSLSTMTPLQAVTLANAARQLAPGNAGTGFNVMSRTQEALGVDNIDIKRDEEGTSVGVGKYVLENVYIEVDKGVENQEDKVRVEIELTPSIGIESEAGTNAEGGVGLYWKKDY